MQLRPANQRARYDHGWLDTQHTFSFAGYYDPEWMGFSHLRVINQDVVAPGRGFGLHPHRNMEILTYPLRGVLRHRDTSGGGGELRHGDVQVMSAGRGIAHEEMNGSREEESEFLQIWLLPAEANTPPRYDQQHFPLERRGAVLLASPTGRDESLPIGQNTEVWRYLLGADESVAHPLRFDRAWVQVVAGSLDVNGTRLRAGDGLAIVETDAVRLAAHEDVELLLFDLR
ncbi:MAG: pirin family protein [Deltaproteobacteria bacterium]|nr:MAG: pirin family protein [Deltaproteobacteria bacterium]